MFNFPRSIVPGIAKAVCGLPPQLPAAFCTPATTLSAIWTSEKILAKMQNHSVLVCKRLFPTFYVRFWINSNTHKCVERYSSKYPLDSAHTTKHKIWTYIESKTKIAARFCDRERIYGLAKCSKWEIYDSKLNKTSSCTINFFLISPRQLHSVHLWICST